MCVYLQSPQPSLSSQVDPFKTQWRITLSSGHWLQLAQKNSKALILPWHTVCLCRRECVFSYFMQAIHVKDHNCTSVTVCICVSECAGGSGLSSRGQVGGDKTPLQCGVVVNWFWLGAKSPHRHLFVFSTRPEKETAFTQASHNTSNSLFEPVLGQNSGVNLCKHTHTHNVSLSMQFSLHYLISTTMALFLKQ